MRDLKAFKITVDGKEYNYREGGNVDLSKVQSYFSRKYKIEKLWNNGRHVIGFLEHNGRKYFLKLATSKGISAVTENEYLWNKNFNKIPDKSKKYYRVPVNADSGFFDKELFYLITDKFSGKLLSEYPESPDISEVLKNNIDNIIGFSEHIQETAVTGLYSGEDVNYKQKFIDKVKLWYGDIPRDVIVKYKILNLLEIVEKNSQYLRKKTRHGDFAPWHIFSIDKNTLGLIDGEHAKSDGVEYYDIGYFIQRVFSVLKSPDLAESVIKKLINRKYDMNKLTTILASRAIGGFLDESLSPTPKYGYAEKFRDFVYSFN